MLVCKSHVAWLFFLGKGKKTSHLSRSSSGFESSHLPSPEYPTPPLSQSSSRQDPQSLLPPFQITSIKAVHLGANRSLLSIKPLSQSYDELPCIPVPQGLWKRSLSLDYRILHMKEPYNPENLTPIQSVEPDALLQRCSAAEQNEAIMCQACSNQEDESEELGTGDELTFPSVDSSTDVESEDVPVDSAETSPSDPPLYPPRIKPPIPPKPLPPPFVNDKETTNPDNKHVFQSTLVSHKSDPASGIPKSSKPFIHRLGKKVQHARSSNLESLVEEKLILDGIDLTEEPYSDKVFHNIQELIMFYALLYLHQYLVRVLLELGLLYCHCGSNPNIFDYLHTTPSISSLIRYSSCDCQLYI